MSRTTGDPEDELAPEVPHLRLVLKETEDESTDVHTPSGGYGGEAGSYDVQECRDDSCHRRGEHVVFFDHPEEQRVYCLAHALREYRRVRSAFRVERVKHEG